MRPDELLCWYEAHLPARERKLRGHFSTPQLLIEQILDACGYTPDQDLSRLRVLDPACGSGNFLSGALHRLLAFGQKQHLSSLALKRLIQRSLWGFDPDPIACFLAEIQLQTTLDERLKKPLSSDAQTIRPMPGKAHKGIHLHIHQADGLAFPWDQTHNVDLFLANPPYLASKNTDLSGYRSAHGQSDSYLLFLDLALRIVRPGGWICLVLPDAFLARTNAASERQRLLSETTIHHLWHLADVFEAHVGAVVVIAQKVPPCPLHQIHWRRERWLDYSLLRSTEQTLTLQGGSLSSSLAHQTIPQSLLRQQPHSELRYLLGQLQGTVVERLHTHLTTRPITPTSSITYLKHLVIIRRGEEIGKDSALLSSIPPAINEKCSPVLRGGIDIHPYALPRAARWISHHHINKQLDRYLAPKLLVVKSMSRLQATLDLQGHVILQTLYLLQLHQSLVSDHLLMAGQEEDELFFLLALLNSRLLQDYIYYLHTAYKWVQPQIEQYVLAHLPIPLAVSSPEKKAIIQRARTLLSTCSQTSTDVELQLSDRMIYEEQERAIAHMYELALTSRYLSLTSSQADLDKGAPLYG
ncbi:Eco57I restriction-modification methylase domain-containing protein [Tengunoibacter tsumagoiensis]|uniref:site-specific DNA-methyltransferase (adenine-specific) n=1 Tax=Tengunoibacter tsumagoiensis TaxID=2014871 RepID=A0A401ZX15_9CHLR|nr:N-6 DNA methylase [Tengunoibacter tsumagoiensis]GCE11372.1 hypothetical protein KTT_12310 [Tengunoibacter tsumagoiensis]